MSFEENTTTLPLPLFNYSINATPSVGRGADGGGDSIPPFVANQATLIAWIFICSFGLLSNMVFVFVFFRIPSLRYSTNMYLLNMNFADILFLLMHVVDGIILQYYNYYSDEYVYDPLSVVLSPVYTQVFDFFTNAPILASLLTLAFVSIDRFVHVSSRSRAQLVKWKQRETIFSVIFATWLIALLFSVPAMLTFTFTPADRRDVIMLYRSTAALVCLTFTFSVIMVTTMYSLIAFRVYFSFKGAGRPRRRNHRLSLMLVLVTIAYLVLVLPYALFVAPIALIELFPPDWFHSLAQTCLYLNAAFNPVICHITSSRVRQGIHQAFFGCGDSPRPMPPPTQTQTRDSRTTTKQMPEHISNRLIVTVENGRCRSTENRNRESVV